MPTPPAGVLTDKVIVVTGAASGIGAATANACLAAGAHVIGVDVAAGAGVTIVGDITDPGLVRRLADHVEHGPGRVDCLVNNAGINGRAALTELDRDGWDRVLNINVRAGVEIVQALLPFLGSGAAVVGVSSIRARLGFAGNVAYQASKGAIESVTRALAVELAPRGIRVNAVAPGAIRTELSSPALADPDTLAALAARIPLGRVGGAGEVANAIIFLASDAASYITGQVLAVDGGYLVQG
jgi:gluconate 5-dehydrogenase